MNIPFSRRHLLGTGAAFGAAALISASLPVSLRAQGKTLVAATFPGTWNGEPADRARAWNRELDRDILSLERRRDLRRLPLHSAAFPATP